MEEQNSILLQKKIILVLSAVIVILTASLAYHKENDEKAKIACAQNLKSNIITVEKQESKIEKENDIILIEQVAYTASKEVIEENTNLQAENTKKADTTKEKTEETNQNVIKENKQEEKDKDTIKENQKEQKQESIVEDKQEEIKEEATNKDKNEKKFVSYKELAENNPPAEYKEVIEATATAYCLCQKCCGKAPGSPGYGVTASGLKIVPGTGVKVIAVDPKVIPLGSKVYVEGLNGAWDYGYAIAGDTGGAIKSIKVDLYMDSHEETLSWGRKKVNVYVVE